ncbi:MAG TPA: hypothetical protein VGM18_09805 [Candidatus Sulfotelmatobacter sp.]|jgi:hypothetical protein
MPASAELEAVTVTVVDDVTEGAVSNPSCEIVPAVVRQMMTALGKVPPVDGNLVDAKLVGVTVETGKVAENNCWLPDEMVAVAGDSRSAPFADLEVDGCVADVGRPAQPTEK